MAELGLRYVRIGEFAWSRIEPSDGVFDFDWMDDAIRTLGEAGLLVVIGTPTATPPKWLLDKWPDIYPVDPHTGRTRGFGSRRHYDFSSEDYCREALRITEVLARRYGGNEYVAGWQTDNELCCHETTWSASPSARRGFRDWCRARYKTIQNLNDAWGNVFWSMEYSTFDAIELPVGAVTETSPAHRLAYRRYSSDRVVDFHARMVDVIRQHAPDAFVTHNFIPMVDTGVANDALAAPLDFPSYDSYPLGRSDQFFKDEPEESFRRYMRTGHPDFASYYLDQTRGLGSGGFWVMEQQPGPVNWADNNPRPAAGMVRLWTIEAFAHGADCVAYFRWRQVPFGQEQMHAGLLRPDDSRSTTWAEMEQAIREVSALRENLTAKPTASVAIVTGAESYWVTDIERQSNAYRYNSVQFDYYRALRELGVNVDFVSADASLDAYRLVLVPCLPIIRDAFIERCRASNAVVLFGPRSGSKTEESGIPAELPPGRLQRLMPVRVLSVETLRPDCGENLEWQGTTYSSTIWREELDVGDCTVVATSGDREPAIARAGRYIYAGTLTDGRFLRDFFRELCAECGIATLEAGDAVRVCHRGELTFAFNYSAEPRELPLGDDIRPIIGQRTLQPRDVTVWKGT